MTKYAGTATVNTDGTWSGEIPLPQDARSARVLVSHVDFTSDARDARVMTLHDATGSIQLKSAEPLSVGGAVFIVVVPYTARSGGGKQLPSIRVRGLRVA